MPTPTRGRRHNRVGTPILTRVHSERSRPFRDVGRKVARGFLAFAGAVAMLAAAPRVAAAQVDLVLNVTDTPDPVPATGTVTYGVKISNNGLSTATGVTYALTVPTGAQYRGFTAGSGASCSGMAIDAAGPGVVTCTHPAIAANDSGTFTLLLKLNAQGTITVSSTVDENELDDDTADNTVSNTTTVTAGADVAVSLTAPNSISSGTVFNYVLALSNAGPDAATLQRVTLPVPTGFTPSGSLPSGCALAGSVITCNIAGPIASGGTLTVGNISGRITAASGSTVTATATVALQPGAPALTPRDPNTGDNTVVKSISVTAGSDVFMTIARSVAAPYFVGGTFNFVLTAGYHGDVPSTLTIRDTIPANYTIGTVAATQNGWSCAVSGQVVSCTRPSGGVAGFNQSLGSITIPVTINAAGSVTNRAVIAAGSPTDPDLTNNAPTDGGVTLLTPTADLSVAKTGPSPALVVVGVPFAWQLTASNGGPSAFSGNLVLTDSVPTGVTITVMTLNGWTCDQAALIVGPAVVTCQRSYTAGAPLASGASAPAIGLTAVSSATGVLTNIAAVGSVGSNVVDPNTANNRTTHAVTSSATAGAADLRVLKTVDLGTVPAGEVLTYTLEVVNVGPSTAANVTLSDNLQNLINSGAGATGQGFVAHTVTRVGVASGVTCSNAASGSTGRAVSCTIPSLPVCTAGVDCPTVTLAIRPGGNGGARSNSASAISSTTADSNTVNNTGSVTSTVDARADVTVTKIGTPSPVSAGQNLTYVVTARNNGPSSAAAVTVNDSLPLSVFFVSAVPSSGSCSVTPTVNAVTAAGNRRLICNLGTIANGAQATVTVVVRPTTATRGTSLGNTATVSTSTIESASPGDTNNVVTISTAVSNPTLDLLVNKIDSVDPLAIGSTTVYTVTVNNTGPSDAEQVVVRDTLPAAGLSFQSVSPGAFTCSTVPAVNQVGGELVCGIARVAAGGSAAFTLTMQGVTKGVYTNRARVSSSESDAGFDTDMTNNTTPQATTVRTRADMQVVSKTASAASVALRRPYSWVIKVRNNSGAGLTEADTVRVSDNLPSGMELTGVPTVALIAGSTTLTSCTGAAGATSFVCDLGTVSSGGEVDITVPVRNTAVPSGGTTSNSASVTTTSLDVQALNNTNAGSVTITASSLSGTVFRDFNNNGAVDVGDTGIDAITLTAVGTAFDGATISVPANTNGSGLFTVAGLPEGNYTLQRGTVSETYLTVGTQTAGSAGGLAATAPNISGVALGQNVAATGYRFAFIPRARIGLAKRVIGTPVSNLDGTISAVIRVMVKNYGLEDLNAVSVHDPLVGAAPLFGTYVAGGTGASLTPGTYTINALPSVAGACAGTTLNGGFTGSGTTELAIIATLPTSTACEFDFTLRYKPIVPLPPGNFTNQANGSGTGALSGQTPNDLSTDGVNADPDGNGDPANNSVPTPLNAVLTADVTTVATLPGTAAAGTTVSGTVLFKNNGPYTASGVAYSITLSRTLSRVTFSNLPVGVTAIYSSTTGVVTLSGMPATLTSGQVASADGVNPIGVTYTQNAIANSSLRSTISTTTDEGQNLGPNTSNVSVTGPLVVDVTTTVSFPATINAGQLVSGVILFRNNGPSLASGMTFGVTLTPGLTGVTFGNLPGGATASYNSGSGVVTFTGMPATLAASAIASGNGTSGITLSYTQNPTASSTVASSIGTSTSQGANVAPDAATTTVTGVPIADVMTALAFPVTADAGDPVSGTVLFTNNGPSTAAGTTFGLTLTPGLAGVTFGNLPAGVTATYNSGTGVVSFTGMPSSMASGQIVSGNGSTPITLAYTQPGTAISQINSTIGTTTDQGANVGLDAASASPGGGLIADVRTVISAPATVNAGDPVATTVSFSNNGPSIASTVGYTLTLTTGLTNVVFGNLPGGATAAYNAGTGAVTFTGMPVTLASGAIASGNGSSGITVSWTQNPVASSTISATISTSTSQGANIAPDSDTKTVAGTQIADVTTTLTGFPAIVPPGSPVSGRLTYRNAGPSAASSLAYTLTLAPGLTGVTLGNLPGGASTSYNSGNGVVTFSGMPVTAAPGTIISGDGVNGFALTYTQSNALETSIASGIATSTNQGANALPDDAIVIVSGVLGTDLVVRKTTPVTEVTPRDTITYTISATNDGPIALNAGTVLTDTPVNGVSLVSAQCSALGGNLCSSAPSISQLLTGVSLPAMPVGARYELTVRGAVTAPDAGTVTNRARGDVPFGFFDTDSSNNIATAGPITVRARPDLAVTKSVNVDTLRIGGQATYTVGVVNRGTSPTVAVSTITETLPAALTPTAASGTAGFTCAVAGQTVTCTRNTPMLVLDSATITIATTVSATALQAPVTVTACSRTQDDINLPNDCASVLTPVAGRREASLRKEVASEFVVGEPGLYRLWVRNNGTVPLSGPISVVDTLPAGLTYISAQGPSWTCASVSGVVGCSMPGPIAVGDSSLISLATMVGGGAVPTVTNCATVSVQGGAVLTANGRSCATVQARGDYRLVLELTTPRYDRELQDVPDFTVTVRNVGRSPLPDVMLTNLLPRGFTYVAGTSVRGGAPDTVSRHSVIDPTSVTNSITWPLGLLAPGAVARMDYRALIGVGATYNTDNITISSARSSVIGLQVLSNTAQVPIRLRRGLFDNRGMITGKVYVDCNCTRTAGQDAGDIGIPGVRVLMEDGTGAITDVEGKYNFVNVSAGLHVVKVDRGTLPDGAQLVTLNTRNAGDGYSRFVDLKAGELHRADFAEGSRSRAVLEQVLARRRSGEVNAAGAAQLAQALDRPMIRDQAQQGMMRAPVLGSESRAPDQAPATGLTYVPLAAADALNDGNSSLPMTPERATQAIGRPNTTGAGRVSLEIASGAAPADGRRVLPVTVRLMDSTGAPMRGSVAVTLEASAGGWRGMDGDATAKGMQVVVTDGIGRFELVTPRLPVVAQIRATSPVAMVTKTVTFTPDQPSFTAIGLLQGRIDLRSLSRGSLNLATSADGFEESLQDMRITRDSGRTSAGARGALLLKGNVKGAGLLTLAYDTERDRDRTQFRDITPDEGFQVFGDGSLREFDAQSQQRLYLRLDRGTSFLRYGDFATPRSDDRRLLLAYDRSMTGLSYHGEGARGTINSFASRNRIHQVVDELQGRGLSGPYFLSQPTAVINSERVELITRDRNQPSVILKSQPMARFEEYTVEPLTGRLLFRAPVPSLDANMNPVTIRVSYEVEQGGAEFMTYGGDATLRVSKRLEIGGFAVRDENPVDQQTMLGASATAKLGDETTVIGEFARTDAGGSDPAGAAWRVEMRHQSARLEGRIFALHGDTAFANRSSTFVGGRNEFGARWSATLGSRTRLIGEMLRTEDTRTDGRRDGALLGIERRLTSNLVAEVGYRYANEDGAPVSPVLGGGLGSSLTGGSTSTIPSSLTPVLFSAARARITARLPGTAKSSLFAEYEYGLDASQARRGSIGGERILFDKARLYLRHEWLTSAQGPYALGDGKDQQNTVFGIDANYLRSSQVFSEYRARDAFNGRDAEASMGLRNRWALRPGLLANTSFERVTPLAGTTSSTAFAATGAVEWTKPAIWKSTARVEWRTSPLGDNVLASFGYARKLSRDWTMLGRTLYDEVSGGAARGRSQLGLAWRQTDKNRVNALFRVENRLDRTDAIGLPTTRTLSNIAAVLVNMQATPALTFSTRYAAKMASDERELTTTRSQAQLLMARTTYDLSRRFDVGVIGSVMGNGSFHQRRYGVGGELGVVVMRNLRLAGGYNLFGFTDRDFQSLGYTQRGLYLDFGFKFDEALFGKAHQTQGNAR